MSEKPTKFQIYARDHEAHPHCVACGGCLLDPTARMAIQLMAPLWCAGCAARLKASPVGLPRGVIEFTEGNTAAVVATYERYRQLGFLDDTDTEESP